MTFTNFQTIINNKSKEMSAHNQTLFITDIDKNALWELYLDSFPAGTNEIYKTRREYDCNTCKQFIRNFGNVVVVQQDNTLSSVWDVEGLEYPFNIVAKKLKETVQAAPIAQVFKYQFKKIGATNNRQLNEDGTVQTWAHFCCDLPDAYVPTRESVEAAQGQVRETKGVFQRGLEELSLDAFTTVLELIDQHSLARGNEFKEKVSTFMTLKDRYSTLPAAVKDTWCWSNSINNFVAGLKNTMIGTLLEDLSKDEDLNVAVAKYEKKADPTKYQRPTPVTTKKTKEAAIKTIRELGFENSLARRFARESDITRNNVLFADRDVKPKMKDFLESVFDEVKETRSLSPKSFDKVEEISVEDFFNNVLPKATSLSLMVENKHRGNLMSLVAPQDANAPSMFKWKNGFSWSYGSDTADSIKQNVKSAGGEIDAEFRYSIQWNDKGDNKDDLDAHCIEPGGYEIQFTNKRQLSPCGGMLDVDIINPVGVAVENIFYKTLTKLKDGQLRLFVRCYSSRSAKSGFDAEIEFNGEVYQYHYPYPMRQNQDIQVALLEYNRINGFKFIESLEGNTVSTEMWGVKTNQFTKVSMCMLSPNHWDEQTAGGNKHYMFILDGCKNDTQPRGFFNEYLNTALHPHRKAFEALGSVLRVDPSADQLSGLGFSETQRNSIVVKVEGSFSRVLRIKF